MNKIYIKYIKTNNYFSGNKILLYCLIAFFAILILLTSFYALNYNKIIKNNLQRIKNKNVNNITSENVNQSDNKNTSLDINKSNLIEASSKEEITIDNKKFLKYTYTIKKDDTLWKISKKFLNNPSNWKDIVKYNSDIKNPNTIFEEDKLIIYIPE
jgi:LysM repeat protein